jgi:hypothetical protein
MSRYKAKGREGEEEQGHDGVLVVVWAVECVCMTWGRSGEGGDRRLEGRNRGGGPRDERGGGRGGWAWHFLVEGGRVMLVCVSCADGCRAPQDGRTPLMCAARGGKLEVARELISKGADIEAKDRVRRGDWAIDECC